MSFQTAFLLGALLSAAASYLVSSVNTAIIVVRLLYNKDIRTLGSGNAGFTNVMRNFGKMPAIITMVGDLLKGAVSIGLSYLIFWLLGNYAQTDLLGLLETDIIGFIAAIFAILGHSFPIYYGFKGGKGITVALASMLVIDPVNALILLGLFLLVFAIFRMVSLGSIIAAAGIPVATYISCLLENNANTGFETALAAVIAVMLIWMHRQNIVRIFKGTEHKFGRKRESAQEK